MGFDEGQMVLDSPNGTYYSGQTVHGKLMFQQDKVKSFRGLFVKLKGFCKVHWTTTHTRTVNGKSQSYTVHHNSHEEYVNSKMYLVGGESGEHSIQPGKYEFPFQFHLPANCPSSFEGDYGHIRYEVKAVVDRAFKFDQEKKVAVRVMAPMDLNLDPYCREPIDLELQDTYCCCCMSSGASDVSVKLPLSGYCPGQTIPIEVVCSNKGNVQIDDIKLCITRSVLFIATSEPGRKKDKDTVVEIKKGPIPGNTNRNWTVEMEVPAMDVYNLTGCQYIKLDYKFKVVVNPDGCRSDSKESRRLVIGTVPLVGFQDNVQNPLHDQFPQSSAIAQQPMTSYPPIAYPEGDIAQPLENPSFLPSQSYPGNSPYPPTNPYPQDNQPNAPYPPTSSPYPPTSSPYPAANPPYPNVTPYMDNPPPYPGNITNPASNSPYPAANSSYPIEKRPYRDANPPYPTEKESYPGANPPYPTEKESYPGANPPYPTEKESYPGANPPYPTEKESYPGANPPYPTEKESYPGANPPYPTEKESYPGANPPYPTEKESYPGANPSNSGANPPYPGANPPNSGANPPYPVTDSPYPPQNVPYETNSSGMPSTGNVRGLRTGNVGFMTSGGGSGMNLPPPFPHSNPGSQRSASPFATPSAPTLDSPTTTLPEKKD